MVQQRTRSAPVVFGPPNDRRKWVQHANAIAQRIADGTYKPGQWLPILHHLSDDLGGAIRADIYRALDEAAKKRLITRVTGLGCYVGTGDQPPGKPPRPPVMAVPAKPAPNPRQADLTDERFITVKELSDTLRVSPMTCYRMCHTGDIESVRIGRSLRIPETAAQAYINGNRLSGNQPEPEPAQAGHPVTR